MCICPYNNILWGLLSDPENAQDLELHGVLSIILLTGKIFFFWLHWVLVVACGSFVAACGI